VRATVSTTADLETVREIAAYHRPERAEIFSPPC
jgi:hypothetical protein